MTDTRVVKHSPSVATLRRYVQACGKQLRLQVT